MYVLWWSSLMTCEWEIEAKLLLLLARLCCSRDCSMFMNWAFFFLLFSNCTYISRWQTDLQEMYISVAHTHKHTKKAHKYLNIDSQTLNNTALCYWPIVFTKTIFIVFPIESDAIITCLTSACQKTWATDISRKPWYIKASVKQFYFFL